MSSSQVFSHSLRSLIAVFAAVTWSASASAQYPYPIQTSSRERFPYPPVISGIALAAELAAISRPSDGSVAKVSP